MVYERPDSFRSLRSQTARRMANTFASNTSLLVPSQVGPPLNPPSLPPKSYGRSHPTTLQSRPVCPHRARQILPLSRYLASLFC